MKPADVFLGFRHFFGYVVPGFVWVTAVLLAFGAYPGQWPGWFAAVSIILAAYLVGILLQDWLFVPITHLRQTLRWCGTTPTPHRNELLAATRYAAGELAACLPPDTPLRRYADTAIADDNFLDQFCKKWVIERSARALEELNGYEGTINFVVGMIPALGALGVGLAVYLCAFSYPPRIWLSVAALGACWLAATWLFFVRLPQKLESERAVWRNAFLLLVVVDAASRKDNKI